MRNSFFRAASNSIRWLFKDQRSLISELTSNGTGQFETLLIPDYQISARLRRSIYVPRNILMTADEHLIKHIFNLNKEIISSGSAYYFLSPFLGSRSIFVLDNDEHSFAKRQAISTIKRDINFTGESASILDFNLAEVLKEGEYEILPLIQLISAKIVLHSIFPESRDTDSDDVLNAAVENISTVSGSLLLFPTIFPKKLGRMASVRRNKSIILKFIRERLQSGDTGEIYRAQIERHGVRFVADNLLTLFIAGFETTAASITWGLIELSKAPEAQRTVRREVLGNMGSADEFMDYIGSSSTVLHKYCLETFRFKPPIPFILRRVNRAFSYTDGNGVIEFERGNYVLCSIEDHNRKAVEQGDVFSILDRETPVQPSRLLTFGGGPKICPGRHVATSEFKLISALLLSRGSFEPTERTSTIPLKNRVSAVPKCGGHLSVRVIQ